MSELTQLARTGDSRAIASLLNRSLQPKGVTAKVALNGNCLKILLESAQVPNQATSVKFVRSGLERLAPEKVESVRLYGKRFDDVQPIWKDEFELKQVASIKSTSLRSSMPEPKPTTNAQDNPTSSWWINLSGWQKNSIQLVGTFALILTLAYCTQDRRSPQEIAIEECYDELKSAVDPSAALIDYRQLQRTCERMCVRGDLAGC